MALSQDFLVYVLEQFAPWGRVSARRMFGGAGLYRDGLFFGLVEGDTLFLKADAANRGDFEAAGSEPFIPFPDKPGKAAFSYYSVPADVLEQPDVLAEWARRAWAAAARKPRPTAERSRR